MNAATEAGLCGIEGCVYLPHPTGPHSWQTATITVLHDDFKTPEDAA